MLHVASNNCLALSLLNSRCNGQTIHVNANGDAKITMISQTILALHIEQRIPTTPIPIPPPIPASYKRTVIMIQKWTVLGQYLFIRGGLNEDTHGCSGDQSAYTSKCAIPIVHQTNVSKDNYMYYSWSQQDSFLDWFGPEANQGKC